MQTFNDSAGILNIWTDGAARGNPGHAGIGFVVKDSGLAPVKKHSGYIGIATNNVAEYRALISSLEFVKNLEEQKPEKINIFMDSELVVKQVRGEYKVKNQGLIPLHQRVVYLLSGTQYSILYIDRAKNKEADKLANEAIDNYIEKGYAENGNNNNSELAQGKLF